MPGIVIKLNQAGVREILKSPGVQADLERRAKAIAAQANSEITDPQGFVVDVDQGPNRVRVVVVTATPEAMNAEASNRTLTRAFDAGRG